VLGKKRAVFRHLPLRTRSYHENKYLLMTCGQRLCIFGTHPQKRRLLPMLTEIQRRILMQGTKHIASLSGPAGFAS
jgi:hypothetical protein